MSTTPNIRVVSPRPWNVADDNVDVEVSFPDGRRYGATFFTTANIESLFRKNAQTGECAGGLYLWAADMILVQELTQAVIERTVHDLIASGELESAFALLSVDRDTDSTKEQS